jgi:hypothetical protein
MESVPKLFRPFRACRVFYTITQGSASLHPGLLFRAFGAPDIRPICHYFRNSFEFIASITKESVRLAGIIEFFQK